ALRVVLTQADPQVGTAIGRGRMHLIGDRRAIEDVSTDPAYGKLGDLAVRQLRFALAVPFTDQEGKALQFPRCERVDLPVARHRWIIHVPACAPCVPSVS